jgi:hypothetical protein
MERARCKPALVAKHFLFRPFALERLQYRFQARGRFLQLCQGVGDEKGHARFFQAAHICFRDVFIQRLQGQNPVHRLNKGDFASQGMVDLSQLATDYPSAHHQQAGRKAGQLQRLVT